MISKDEVKKIAKLARIEVSDKEIIEFQSDIDSILEYVGQISSLASLAGDVKDSQEKVESNQPFNVIREDKDPHQSGMYTNVLLDEAPTVQNGYVKVKKIL